MRCVTFFARNKGLVVITIDTTLYYCISGKLRQRHPRDSCRFSFRCLSNGRRSGECDESLMGEESEIRDLGD